MLSLSFGLVCPISWCYQVLSIDDANLSSFALANATGFYGGFTKASSGGGGGGSSGTSDQFSWLRGGYTTNAAGVVEVSWLLPLFW